MDWQDENITDSEKGTNWINDYSFLFKTFHIIEDIPVMVPLNFHMRKRQLRKKGRLQDPQGY